MNQTSVVIEPAHPPTCNISLSNISHVSKVTQKGNQYCQRGSRATERKEQFVRGRRDVQETEKAVMTENVCRLTSEIQRKQLTKKSYSQKEFNFNSKLVKVTIEDMREKPRKTRNWKGRRAAERKLKNLNTDPPLLSLCLKRSNETGTGSSVEFEDVRDPQKSESQDLRMEFRSCLKNSSVSTSETETIVNTSPYDFTFADFMRPDTHIEESLASFLTSFDSLPACDEYSRWSSDLQNLFFDKETESRKEISKNSPCISGRISTRVSKPRINPEWNETRVGSWRFFRFFYYIYLKELWEADRLKRQEREILEKIEKATERRAKKMNHK